MPEQWDYQKAGLDLKKYEETIAGIQPLLARTHDPLRVIPPPFPPRKGGKGTGGFASLFDLDPSDADPTTVRRGARAMAGLVRELGLEPWAMGTGSRGYHVTVPLRRRADFDDVRGFARAVAELARRREPRLFTTEQRKAKREGKILIDVMRNAYTQAAVAPYAVRARPGAPVATPLHLEELTAGGTRADRWTLRTVVERVEHDGDPWAEISKRGRDLGVARRRLQEAQEEDG